MQVEGSCTYTLVLWLAVVHMEELKLASSSLLSVGDRDGRTHVGLGGVDTGTVAIFATGMLTPDKLNVAAQSE